MAAIQRDTSNPSRQTSGVAAWQFRTARAADAHVCAPLIFASGVSEFGYFLGEPADICTAFLRSAFASRFGRFSWRRHRVAVAADGTVISLMAAHDGRSILFDDAHIALMLFLFFGARRTVGMLLRGLYLHSELPAPARAQTLLAHCATHESARGNGVFSALMEDVLGARLPGGRCNRQIVLDVLISNMRARDLYRRLGFVELPRSRACSQRLPPELESVRMRLQRSD
jgi:ribosomal protein S18 acetylase RimI-like enzyme